MYLAVIEVPGKNTYIGLMEGEPSALVEADLYNKVVRQEKVDPQTTGVKVTFVPAGRIVSLGLVPSSTQPDATDARYARFAGDGSL